MISSFHTRDTYFLSNFFTSTFSVNGVYYRTVEHYFQAQKTRDAGEQLDIRQAQTPKEAKQLGRKATLREDWEEVKLEVMRVGVRAKFEQNEILRQRLLDTGDQELREGNHWGDLYWGVDETTGEGENWLGRILMEVREQLKEK